MDLSNVWNFMLSIFDFLLDIFDAMQKLWTFSFTIPLIGENGTDLTITFPQMLTTALSILILALIIKKFVPVA